MTIQEVELIKKYDEMTIEQVQAELKELFSACYKEFIAKQVGLSTVAIYKLTQSKPDYKPKLSKFIKMYELQERIIRGN